MDRYAVIGNPVAHSKSPLIHAAFARQTGQALRYEALLGPLGRFRETVEEFRRAGGLGLNVTVPFKEEAWAYAERRSGRATRAAAVNTLMFDDTGACFGDNTDGVGLVRDLQQNLGLGLGGLRILVLGAGGAVRGILEPLAEAGPASIRIANRTVSRARRLATDLGSVAQLQVCGFDELTGMRFDLIINGTSAGLSGELPALPAELLHSGGVCYDLMYADRPTAFMGWGRGQGAALVSDGLGMLVEQAAESFSLWRGVRPETAPVLAALRSGRKP